MSTTTMVHVRIDERVKNNAAKTLSKMGLSLSDAVRVFLTRVVADKQMPFDIKVPNAKTRAAIAEAESMIENRRVRFESSEELFNALKKETRK